MSKVIIDSIESYYTIKGQGQPVVLLHGWGQNTQMMDFIQDYLSNRFKVLNLDFPGHGLSGLPPKAYSVDDYEIWLEELLKIEHIENPIIIGHSFGCRVAIVYASKNKVNKLVLTGGAGIKDKISLDKQIKTKLYKVGKKLAPNLAKKYADKVGSSDYKNASGVMRGTFVKVVNQDLTNLLPLIKCETLLVWGDKDDATPLWMGKKMEKLIPNAGLAIFNGQGHFAYFYQPQRFLRVLDAFL